MQVCVEVTYTTTVNIDGDNLSNTTITEKLKTGDFTEDVEDRNPATYEIMEVLQG